MGIRFGIAKGISSILTWGLSNVAHRPAANMPGKMALYADPQLIAHARGRLRKGSIVVVGTNGKTTVTNLIADCVEQSGQSVICNRTGANLDSGVASALLQTRRADWGVFESDELWLAKILPGLCPRYVVLLNLFRDQLDRCGEIDIIQDSIVRALASSPESVLVYNADDPLCAMIAERAAAVPERTGVPEIPFGVAECMNLTQNVVSDSNMCQRCLGMLEYDFRQYGQLGAWRCPSCGFARPELAFKARDVEFTPRGLSFRVVGSLQQGKSDMCGTCGSLDDAASVSENDGAIAGGVAVQKVEDAAVREAGTAAVREAGTAGVQKAGDAAVQADFPIQAKLSGHYMVYNLLAVGVSALLLGCDATNIQRAINAFDPKNGRLQDYEIAGRKVLLNLAKNPTGFNQNLRIISESCAGGCVAHNIDTQTVGVLSAAGAQASVSNAIGTQVQTDASNAAQAQASASRAVGAQIDASQFNPSRIAAFFINDKEADGHDISWIWDIDFEELADIPNMRVFAGGIRRNDLQVRLKYAGIDADLVEDVRDVFAKTADAPYADIYVIANYTALSPVKRGLDELAAEQTEAGQADKQSESGQASVQPESKQSGPASEQSEGGQVSDQAEKEQNNLTSSQLASEQGGTIARDSHYMHECDGEPVVIAHMFPDLLNLYGDGGNVRILEQRLRWRSLPVEVRRVEFGDTIDFNEVDIVFLGGGPDREQTLAAEQLMKMRDELADYALKGGPVVAICGGYQILGRTWLLGEEEVPGLGILNIETRRPGTSKDRIVGNVALKSPLAEHPVIGYENHASRTYLDSGTRTFGQVVSRTGKGNNDESHADGALDNTIVGTYLHGPLLSKNPEVADWILERALDHRAARLGQMPRCAGNRTLSALDDSVELAANEFMAQKLI